MNIAIIGGGIGGLTTSIALNKLGISNTIYEKTKVLKHAGAGIILAQNAMQVYKKLGLYDAIKSKGFPLNELIISDPKLKPVAITDLTYFEKKTNVKSYAIHRGDLQAILMQNINSSNIKLNKTLIDIVNKDQVTLKFEDGTTDIVDAVIGADGIHSVVRKFITNSSKIRDAKQICWRGICDFQLPNSFQFRLYEAWGKGSRFGFVQINTNQVYWYALKNIEKNDINYTQNDIANIFSSYHPLINEVLANTKKEHIIVNNISDLYPIKHWFSNNICLLGDAAHATTPNLGQGACQAIEDAYIMAQSIHENRSFEKAFKQYQSIRFAKANLVVNTSWNIGKLAHLSNPFACFIRNLMMKNTPNRLSRKQTEKILL